MSNVVAERYTEEMIDIMKLLFPQLSKSELQRAIQWSINNRFTDHDCSICNSYKEIEANSTLYKLTEYIMSRRPIITSYGCLFTRHGEVENPLYQLIEEFAQTRTKFKKEMLKYPKGSEEYNTYNLLQLVAKVDTNA